MTRTKIPFCSPKCYGEHSSIYKCKDKSHNWRGGEMRRRYGKEWLKIRDRIKSINNKCSLCKQEKNTNELHVHHYIPYRLFNDNQISIANQDSNLGVYCNICHPKIEKISRLIWNNDFFNRSNIANTLNKIENKSFHCYSVYK